jgi:hypothetical protein
MVWQNAICDLFKWVFVLAFFDNIQQSDNG